MKSERIKIVIDQGSTNSVIAWQRMKLSSQGTWEPDPEDEQTPYTIPSIYDKGAGKYGKSAEEYILQTPRDKVHIVHDFKEKLYSADPAVSAEGERCTTEFLAYMRSFFEKNNLYSEQFLQNADKQVLLTVPVTASGSMRSRMKKIAVNAGFTAENGYDPEQIQIIDEGRSLVDFACMDPSLLLTQEISTLQYDPDAHILVLFVDIGGLTADINLAQIRYDAENEYAIDIISSWPDPDKKLAPEEMCGGTLLDRALCEYLTAEGFIERAAADREIAAHGYQEFRKLKESFNNVYWKYDDIPYSLEGLEGRIGSHTKRKYHRCSEDEQLSAEKFVGVVAKDYIKKLKAAVRTASVGGGGHPKADAAEVNLRNIDWVFLTGGGSQMFFIRDLFLGQAAAGDAGRPLELKKIHEQPFRLLCGNTDAPTQSCALGALRFTGRAKIDAHHQYILRVTVSAVKKTGESVVLHTHRFIFAEKHEQYPLRKYAKCEFQFTWAKDYETIRIGSEIETDGKRDENVMDEINISFVEPKKEKHRGLKSAGIGSAALILAPGAPVIAAAMGIGALLQLGAGVYKAQLNGVIDVDADGKMEVTYDLQCEAATGKGKASGNM